MRFVEFLLLPPDGHLHPLEAAVDHEPDLQRVAIHQFRPLADGTAVVLYELTGDADAAEAILAGHDTVRSYDVSAAGDDLFVHARVAPNELTERVYDIPRQHDLLIDPPMRYADKGAIEIRAVGTFETFRTAMAEMPDEVGLRLLRTGEYAPEGGHLFSTLTERQQETLRAAVEAGYYEEPREVTYEAVAERLGVAPGTVGEHLRKVEATIMQAVLPER